MKPQTYTIFAKIISRMKILFVANRVPYPPFRGDKLKIFHLATQLKKRGHELHLITIAENRDDLEQAKHLSTLFDSMELHFLPKYRSLLNVGLGLLGKRPLQVAYFDSASFNRKLENKLKEGYDAVHVQHIRMGAHLIALNRANAILDLPDAFSLYWERRMAREKRFLHKWWNRLEYRRMLSFEKKVLPMFSLNLVCSSEDLSYLQQNTAAHLDILPNGVDTQTFSAKPHIQSEPYRILFTGNMDYEPNIDAVAHFCEDIFPQILKTLPQAQFVIAGQRPDPRVLKLATNKVTITGFIPDISEEYAKAHIVVAPLRFGAGTQNKVLEALSVGVPVVCTQVGFKGLDIENGEGALLANSTEEFTQTCIELLTDEAYHRSVASKGAEKIRTRFSWEAVAEKLENYFKGVR